MTCLLTGTPSRGAPKSRTCGDVSFSCQKAIVEKATYLDVSVVFTLYGSNAASIVELDLPYAAKIGEEVTHTSACAHIPHLQGSVGSGDDLLTIMLEASDGSSMRAEFVSAVAVFGVPYAESRIGGSRDQEIVLQRQKTDQRAVTFQIVDQRAVFQGPNLDHMVHGTADAAVALVVQYHAVDLQRMTLESVQDLTSRNFPNAHSAIVTAAGQCVAVGRDGTDRV